MGNNHPVKVRLKLGMRREHPTGEGLWTRQVDGNSGAGSFELLNSSFYVPLAVGDVVHAELDADGHYQVTSWVRPGPHTATTVRLDPTRCDVQAVTDRWRSTGAVWTEGIGNVVIAVWRSSFLAIADVLDSDVAAGHARWLDTSLPGDRGGLAIHGVDVMVTREPSYDDHVVTTDYWVGDDPYWREHGLLDADFLAAVQLLAWEDADVARALEQGEQDRVVGYMSRRNAPEAVRHLEGPVFETE